MMEFVKDLLRVNNFEFLFKSFDLMCYQVFQIVCFHDFYIRRAIFWVFFSRDVFQDRQFENRKQN